VNVSAPPKPGKQFPPPVKKVKTKSALSWQSRREIGLDVTDGTIARQDFPLLASMELRPQSLGAPDLSHDFCELIAVVGLRGGSRVTGGLSAQGLANVAVRDWSDDFTFIIGDHQYRCPSSVARFLSPCVSRLHWIDPSIDELRLEVEDRDDLFGSVLEAVGGGSIAVDSAQRRTFEAICAVCRIQSFIDAFIRNFATKLQWRTPLIVFYSCRRLNATFPQSSSSLHHISAISYLVAMH
jgi:hypothetical protein